MKNNEILTRSYLCYMKFYKSIILKNLYKTNKIKQLIFNITKPYRFVQQSRNRWKNLV